MWANFLCCLKLKISICLTGHPLGPWPLHSIRNQLFRESLASPVGSGQEEASVLGRHPVCLPWTSTEGHSWVSWGHHFSIQTRKGSLPPILQCIDKDGEQRQTKYQLLKNAVVIRCQLDFVPLITEGLSPSPAGQLIFTYCAGNLSRQSLSNLATRMLWETMSRDLSSHHKRLSGWSDVLPFVDPRWLFQITLLLLYLGSCGFMEDCSTNFCCRRKYQHSCD